MAIASLTPISIVAAQGGLAETTNTACNLVDPSVSAFQSVRNGSLQSQCTSAGTLFTAASAVNGVLRASAWFDPSTTPEGVRPSGTAIGRAVWSDRLVVAVTPGAPAAAFARFTFAWNGVLEGDIRNGNAVANFSYGARGAPEAAPRNFVTYATETIIINESFSFLAPLSLVSPNQYGSDFSLFLTVSAGGGGDPAGAGLRAMFGNSAGLTNVQVLDENQQLISDASYSFAQGLQLYPTQTVPEPGTWMLLGTGLLALGALGRRRGRRLTH